MKLLIVAGGGGHFAPALAVIEKLPQDWDVLLVGRKYSLEGDKALSFEYQTAKQLGIPFRPVTTGRLQRTLTKHTFLSLLKTPIGLYQSIQTMRFFRPDVVLTFGGYVSVPVVLAAKALRIPIIVHEQILEAGAANKFAARFAKKVCISWNESSRFFPKEKIILTGNPIRRITSGKQKVPKFKDKLPCLYITGGSAGAHAINLLIEGCIEQLLASYNIIHQTGDAKEFNDFERLNSLRNNLSETLKQRYLLKKFIDPADVFEIYQQADLIVSRSGINTVTELLYFGKPSLLIPLPYGQRNEQLKNALFIKSIGLSEVEEQKDLTPEKVYLKIREMFDTIDAYRKNAEKGKKLLDVHAADKIIEVIKHARNEKKNIQAK
jgi:UDP-N-acetylglucosamine--N-acetylmuramyl-(pentapeptide) pyrophosphoryl-undecaprenol N-acetylglucosamine transferase